MQPAATSGWQARLDLGFRAGAGRTVLAERRRSGPLSVQRALYPEGGVCHAYILHPPGGVVGGDELDINCNAGAGTSALVTTPGATKFYRSQGNRARQMQNLDVGAGATLEWLPHENIYFPGALVAARTRVRLAAGARLALWESHCLGRPVIGERFDSGSLDLGLEIWRDGVPLLLERMRLDGAEAPAVSRLGRAPVTASLVMSHCDAAALGQARDAMSSGPAGPGDHAGATLLDDLLVVRYLGWSTARAHRMFSGIWLALRDTAIGHAPQVPRIWAT